MFAPKPVILVGLITAICLLGDSALYALLPSRFEVFAVTPTGVGIILGINRFIRILSNGWASRAYERYGFYRPFAFSIFLAVITTLGYGIGKGLWPLVIAHGMWGIAWSLIRMGGYLAVIDSSKGNTGPKPATRSRRRAAAGNHPIARGKTEDQDRFVRRIRPGPRRFPPAAAVCP